jgi:hypothetical protein
MEFPGCEEFLQAPLPIPARARPRANKRLTVSATPALYRNLKGQTKLFAMMGVRGGGIDLGGVFSSAGV